MENSTKSKMWRIPHPKRFYSRFDDDYQKGCWRQYYDVVKKYLSMKEFSLTDVMMTIEEHAPISVAQILEGEGRPSIDIETSASLFGPWRFHEWSGRCFQTTDALEQLFEKSDIGATCPNRLLHLPYPAVYFEFGETRCNTCTISHPDSGEHTLEGAYAFEIKPVTMGFSALQGLRARMIEVVLIGSPIGKEHPFDDAIDAFALVIENEDECLEKTLNHAINKAIETRSGALAKEKMEAMRKGIYHLVKCILYVNSNCKQWRKNYALTAAMQQYAELGKKKRARLQRKMQGLYDRICLGPDKMPGSMIVENGKAEFGKSPHWRRGHFRFIYKRDVQAQRKQHCTFIAPTLIRKDLIAEHGIKIKDYDVTT